MLIIRVTPKGERQSLHCTATELLDANADFDTLYAQWQEKATRDREILEAKQPQVEMAMTPDGLVVAIEDLSALQTELIDAVIEGGRPRTSSYVKKGVRTCAECGRVGAAAMVQDGDDWVCSNTTACHKRRDAADLSPVKRH